MFWNRSSKSSLVGIAPELEVYLMKKSSSGLLWMSIFIFVGDSPLCWWHFNVCTSIYLYTVSLFSAKSVSTLSTKSALRRLWLVCRFSVTSVSVLSTKSVLRRLWLFCVAPLVSVLWFDVWLVLRIRDLCFSIGAAAEVLSVRCTCVCQSGAQNTTATTMEWSICPKALHVSFWSYAKQ